MNIKVVTSNGGYAEIIKHSATEEGKEIDHFEVVCTNSDVRKQNNYTEQRSYLYG